MELWRHKKYLLECTLPVRKKRFNDINIVLTENSQLQISPTLFPPAPAVKVALLGVKEGRYMVFWKRNCVTYH